PLARVARVACPARELLLPADIDECERRVAEAAAELGQRRERLEPRRQLGTGAVELDDARFEVALPAGQAAGEHRDVRMARELGQLRGGVRGDAVATVVEDEPLLPAHAVAA